MSTAVHRSSDPTHFKIQLADEPDVNLCGFLLGFYTVIWYDLFHLEKSAVTHELGRGNFLQEHTFWKGTSRNQSSEAGILYDFSKVPKFRAEHAWAHWGNLRNIPSSFGWGSYVTNAHFPWVVELRNIPHTSTRVGMLRNTPTQRSWGCYVIPPLK